MSQIRRYFDNAATSHPKPSAVAQAVQHYFEHVHASAGRGAYREAVHSERILQDCRRAIRELFACHDDDHVIFTLNGTDALNLAIKGLVRPHDHVVTTCMDHNSVLRPLAALQQRNAVTWTAVEADPLSTLLSPAAISAAIQPNTGLVALNHASNVTGALQPLPEIAEICKKRGIPLLLDAAQSAGHVPIDFHALGIDLLACPGHKGLMGPLGTGILLIRAGFEDRIQTIREGGTGSASESLIQPESLPDRFESGSHNAVGIAGLLAAVRWIGERGVEAVREHDTVICRRMIDRLGAIDGLNWWGPRDSDRRVGVFSVRIDGFEPAEVSALLESRAGVLSRSGLHCAPLAHQAIGTLDQGGTTRLSTGAFTTTEDVDIAADALTEIARNARQGGAAGISPRGHTPAKHAP